METIHLKKNIEPELTFCGWFKNVYEAVKSTLIGLGITFKYVWAKTISTSEEGETIK